MKHVKVRVAVKINKMKHEKYNTRFLHSYGFVGLRSYVASSENVSSGRTRTRKSVLRERKPLKILQCRCSGWPGFAHFTFARRLFFAGRDMCIFGAPKAKTVCKDPRIAMLLMPLQVLCCRPRHVKIRLKILLLFFSIYIILSASSKIDFRAHLLICAVSSAALTSVGTFRTSQFLTIFVLKFEQVQFTT